MAEPEPDLQILEAIERDPDLTQANLATQMGVAVGRVNWYLKRLIGKGYIKVTHLQRRKLHYFLTPTGLALKLELTRGYMQASLRVYRELREAAQQALTDVRNSGYTALRIEGRDEATEILHLTCLEQGIKVEKEGDGLPLLKTDGMRFAVTWPESGSERPAAGQGQDGTTPSRPA
jgi:DNA-binding MarR family transcriptional regulator